MYKDRELPDRTRSLLIIQNGEPVALNKLFLDGTPYWIEGYITQRMQAAASQDSTTIPLPYSFSVGPGLPPSLDSETYPFNPATEGHEIFINVRLPGRLVYLTTSMIDDTGSNTFNLYYSEAITLGYHVSCDPTFQTLIGTAGAPIQRDTIIVEIQVIGRNEAPLTHWMAEIAALINPPGERLSGQAIRSQLYFVTAPRTHHQISLCIKNKDWVTPNPTRDSLGYF